MARKRAKNARFLVIPEAQHNLVKSQQAVKNHPSP
jgi:hypothetical protein